MRSKFPEFERKILVIDDDAVICEVAEAMLHEAGWRAKQAYTPEEALDKSAGESWPVVLCDVHLPGDNGELLRTLRERLPQTQVVMITGDPTMTSIRQAMRSGAYDYLPKPLRREELLRVTELAFERYKLTVERDFLERENERYRQQLEELVQKRTEQLRETELRYRTLFDLAVDAIVLVSLKDGTVSELNGTASRLLGGKSFDLQGRSIRDFVATQLDECLANGNEISRRIWQFPKLELRGVDREQHVTSATVNRIELEGETYLQIVARQFTDLTELVQRSEIMETELMNEQRLAAIGLLASGVAHNINTPLMGIYGLAQVIKMKHPEIQDVDGVIAQVERINGIVRNLMWKSRQEQESAKQDIDLNVLLQEELRFLEADMDFKHNVEKVFEFASNLPPIFGRYSDFSQSLTNIIRNALDAMYDSESKRLRVTTATENGNIVLTVEDSGKGIDPDHVQRIFEPFFTTKPPINDTENGQPTGTGLGLSTVQKLLNPYGCTFDVQSTPNHGTKFTVYVPVEPNQFQEAESSKLAESDS
ncbi:response regulator [bacterium]|nr:response regulator [bacterium]